MDRPHERAKAVVGAPFRAHGRDAARGFDCIGLVLHAFANRIAEPPKYKLSDGDWEQIENVLTAWFRPLKLGRGACDDLIVFRLPRCFHFAVLTECSTIHADLRLGRVVERPFSGTWPATTRFYRHFRLG